MTDYAACLGVLVSIAAKGNFLYVSELSKWLKEWDVRLDVIEGLISSQLLERKLGLDREEVIMLTLEGNDWVRSRLKLVESPDY